MNKKSTRLSTIVIIVLVALLAGSWTYIWIRDRKTPEKPDNDPTEVIEEPVVDPELLKLKWLWEQNKQINEDYVGELFFDSDLINVSFVQAKDVYKPNGELYEFYTQGGSVVKDPTGYTGNDVYIWKYWKTGAYDYNDNGGSVFLDYRNELSDQNLIIYGHHFSVWNDETRTKAFTPLERLLNEEEYEANRYATMVLGNEIRKYELVCVYEFDATVDRFYDDFQYWRTEYNYDDYLGYYDDDYYQKYINAISSQQLYPTAAKLTTADKTLTLQTCISGHTGELFEIVVLKQIEVISLGG